jgi:Flp pilus assembly CpaF family ATPase
MISENIILPKEEQSYLIKIVIDESMGLGPLEDLLADPLVTEVTVNRYDSINFIRNGKINQSGLFFTSESFLRNCIDRLAVQSYRRIDEAFPILETELPDGKLMKAIVPPIAVGGCFLSIRKSNPANHVFENWIQRGGLSENIGEFLKICLKTPLSILISSDTGIDGDDFLQALIPLVPVRERIALVVNSFGLVNPSKNMTVLKSRPPNIEGIGEVTLNKIVKTAKKLSLERLIVTNINEETAYEAVQNSSLKGTIGTLQASDVSTAISILENYCRTGETLPFDTARELVALNLNLIIQINRFSDGISRITSIAEVVGMQGSNVTFNNIYYFKQEDMDKNSKIIGRFLPTGRLPSFIEKYKEFSQDLFKS